MRERCKEHRAEQNVREMLKLLPRQLALQAMPSVRRRLSKG